VGNVTRRGFLQVLGAATAAVAAFEVDPEFLLWRPGAKTIFLPPPKALVVPETTIVTAQDMTAALEEGLVVLYPDGTRHTISGKLDVYGGLDGLRAHVRRHGGALVENRTWRAYEGQRATVKGPTIDAQVGEDSKVHVRMLQEWDLELEHPKETA